MKTETAKSIFTNLGTKTLLHWGEVVRETEKAYNVSIMYFDENIKDNNIGNSRKLWVPKSQIEFRDDDVYMADWLAVKLHKELSKA